MSTSSRQSAMVASYPSDPAPSVPTPQGTIRVVASDPVGAAADHAEAVALEATLLDFDPDDDIESVVSMPSSIPRALRRVLTRAFVDRFEHYEELDLWLHLPHPALGGDTPFERIVGGDGWEVLRVLVGAGTMAPERGRPHLRASSAAGAVS